MTDAPFRIEQTYDNGVIRAVTGPAPDVPDLYLRGFIVCFRFRVWGTPYWKYTYLSESWETGIADYGDDDSDSVEEADREVGWAKLAGAREVLQTTLRSVIELEWLTVDEWRSQVLATQQKDIWPEL